jgi:hypothetical protein
MGCGKNGRLSSLHRNKFNAEVRIGGDARIVNMESLKVLSSLDGLTARWLTERLRAGGYLEKGRVVGIVKERVFSNNATSAVFTIEYSAEVENDSPPKSLFVKIANPGVAWNRVEFDFYTRIVPEMQQKRPDVSWPFPYCYDAAFAEDGSSAHLILEDLSTTHVGADAPLPPAPDQAVQVVDGLAAFHAYWWEDKRLGGEIGRRQTAASLEEMLVWARGNFERWSAYVGGRLSPQRRAILAEVVADWPARRKARILAGKGLTLVHRDTHPLNFLYSRESGEEQGKIVDWQSWRVDSATDDLAYMMACHWYPEYRRRLERPLVERYHQWLLEYGVNDYDWEMCWYDYRASVIRCLFFLVGGWHEKRPATMWWERLEKGLLAFNDLNCQTLLT